MLVATRRKTPSWRESCVIDVGSDLLESRTLHFEQLFGRERERERERETEKCVIGAGSDLLSAPSALSAKVCGALLERPVAPVGAETAARSVQWIQRQQPQATDQNRSFTVIDPTL